MRFRVTVWRHLTPLYRQTRLYAWLAPWATEERRHGVNERPGYADVHADVGTEEGQSRSMRAGVSLCRGAAAHADHVCRILSKHFKMLIIVSNVADVQPCTHMINRTSRFLSWTTSKLRVLALCHIIIMTASGILRLWPHILLKFALDKKYSHSFATVVPLGGFQSHSAVYRLF